MRIFVAALIVIVSCGAALADEAAVIGYGRGLVTENCSGCHGVGVSDKSTHPQAPEFRTLSQRYPLDALEEAFVEGIDTGHPDMPKFVATPEQITAILTYIATLNK
jgi:mono/diheme cytochrome c family protein